MRSLSLRRITLIALMLAYLAAWNAHDAAATGRSFLSAGVSLIRLVEDQIVDQVDNDAALGLQRRLGRIG